MADLLTRVRQTEESLGQLDAEPQARIGLLCTLSPALWVTILACWRQRLVVVPLSTRYQPEQIEQALCDMGCSHCVASECYRERVQFHKTVTLESLSPERPGPCGGLLWDQLDLDLSQQASLVLTSGSTGQPKGVLHTLSNHYYSALGADSNIPFRAGDTWLVSLPMYHVSGLSLVARALLHGAGLHFPATPKVPLTESLSQNAITHVSLVPLQLHRLLDDTEGCERLSKLKAVLVGGAACPRAIIQRCDEWGIPLYLTYGSSEMSSQVTTTQSGAAARHPASSGRLLPHRELKIADDGEILLKGETRFQGYVAAGQLTQPFDAEGWFASGDLGYLNPMGDLIVTGRKDTRFDSGGEKIYPEEIEREIEAIEGVERCVVVPVPSGRYGKRPVAFVTLGTGRTVDRIDFRAKLRLIERYKIPDAFFPMPADQVGRMKVDRAALIERARQLMQG